MRNFLWFLRIDTDLSYSFIVWLTSTSMAAKPKRKEPQCPFQIRRESGSTLESRFTPSTQRLQFPWIWSPNTVSAARLWAWKIRHAWPSHRGAHEAAILFQTDKIWEEINLEMLKVLPQNVRSFRMPQTLFPKNTGLHQDLKQLRGMRKSMVCVDARFAKSSHLLCLPILSCQKLRLTICQSGEKAKNFSPKFWDTCKESKLENCIQILILQKAELWAARFCTVFSWVFLVSQLF